MAEFLSVFDGQVHAMPREKFHISLTADAQPFCVIAPRTIPTIPFAYRDKLEEIDLLESQGIITPVTEPTEWCAPIVVTPKKNSDRICMCVDLSKLNKFVRQECYPSTTPAEAGADITQKRNILPSLMPWKATISVPSTRRRAKNWRHSLLPLAAISIWGLHIGFHQSVNTTTEGWMKHLLV